jgi:type II secretory pathway component PulM
MGAKRWGDLSPRARKMIVGAGIAESGLKLAVLVDLRRRPASEIRGRKMAWASAMLVNSAGIIPASYFLFGRRRAARGYESHQ